MALENQYWQRPVQQKSSSNTLKILALIIIIVVISAGVLLLLTEPITNTGGQQVKVAVLDSGIDSDFSLIGKVDSEKSFISPLYDYNQTDSTTTDSSPEDIPHGTLVAKTIVAQYRNVQLVNAKVLDTQGAATVKGLIAAIEWSVEQNCSVINLSLGSSPAYGDPLERVVKWAFERGVVVVAACGNEGESGLAGTSISSPSLFTHCISVAAIDEEGVPEDYSSTGPTSDHIMKPDIAALGSVETPNAIYFGTSFAAPRVAGAAAEIIAYCISNSIQYTPGSIMTAILKAAKSLPYPAYSVGAGQLDANNAINIISHTSQNGSLPSISYAHPASLPIDYERLFSGDTYTFNIHLLTSGSTEFNVHIISETPAIFDIPSNFVINQSGIIPLSVATLRDLSMSIDGIIEFNSDEFGSTNLSIDFDVSEPAARIAFDISHTPWSIDTYYGQFKEYYKLLTTNEISVSEIRQGTQVSSDYLSQFDAVFLLDPCAWDINETDINNPTTFSLPFSEEEIQAYQGYYENGGGLFVVALSNESINIEALNAFLNWSDYALGYEGVSNGGDTIRINQIEPHPITVGVQTIDYSGSALEHIPSDGTILAEYGTIVCLACSQNLNGGRIVVTGSNYWIDNWGITGNYRADDNNILSLRVALWLCDLIE
jgi:hypothetical protein